MKKISILLVMSGTLSLLTGCKDEKPPEVVQTVDWYKANKPERMEMLKKCKNNPGELAATPNCMNASRAESQLTWSNKNHVNIKPMTAEELKNSSR